MRAMTYRRYGQPKVLELEDMPKPVVKAESILIRVRTVSLNRSDWENLIGWPAYVRISGAGLLRPRRPILGSDVAGVVEEVGSEVTEFRPGDEVLADTMYFGAAGFAEYVSIPERAPVVPKPTSLSFAEAAALPQAAVLAHHALQQSAPIGPGHHVLIIGAGGGAGSFAVQMAKNLGATVTGVDNGLKQDMMRSIGADHVIDYTQEGYLGRGRRYDRILDFVAARSVFAYPRALTPGGIYRVMGGPMRRLLGAATVGWVLSKLVSKKLGIGMARPNKDDLAHIAELVAAGTLRAAIDDRDYTLEEVPEALEELGADRALGKLVVTI